MISEKTKVGVLAVLIALVSFALIYWVLSGIVSDVRSMLK
jgi:hypothetical protein